MKKSILLITMAVLFIFFTLEPTGFSAEEMRTHDMPMEHGGHKENRIRETNINGFHLSYHLINMQIPIKDMKGLKPVVPEKGTHHLMLYIRDAEGKNMDSAQVGYQIIRPDGEKQNVMAMAMSGAYGADIHLTQPGEHTIHCKAVVGGNTLLDEFKYRR